VISRKFTAPAEWPEPVLPPANRRVLAEELRQPGVPHPACLLHIAPYRSTVIRLGRSPRGYRLSLHSALAKAPAAVFRAAVRVVWRRVHRQPVDPGDRGMLEDFCRAIPAVSARRSRQVDPAGRHADLRSVLDDLLGTYWPEADRDLSIGWTVRRAVRKLAYCRPESGQIWVSRALDHPAVPRYYLDFLVYHELLHMIVPPVRRGGCCQYHHRQFRELERRFPRYDEAIAFQARIPGLLDRSRR